MTMAPHKAVTVQGWPYADPAFDYAAHDRWVARGYCPVVSSSKAWCSLPPGHAIDRHASPWIPMAGQAEVLRYWER